METRIYKINEVAEILGISKSYTYQMIKEEKIPVVRLGRRIIMANAYMDELGREFENLRKKKLTEKQVMEYIGLLIPLDENGTSQQKRNVIRLQNDMKMRYFDAPDLKDVGNNAYRFINAVSDFATHAKPLRKTANYKEQVFARTVEGNPLIDKAYKMMCAA